MVAELETRRVSEDWGAMKSIRVCLNVLLFYTQIDDSAWLLWGCIDALV